MVISPESPAAVASQFPANYHAINHTEYPPQRTDYRYGLHSGGLVRYLSPPAPGAVHTTSTAYTAVTSPVNASVGRGFFKDAFQLVLSCPEAGATIRYTTNFTEPTTTIGTVYSSPITISTTTCLRAVAVVAGKVTSLPVTQSYLFLDQVRTQPAASADFPADWGTAYASNTFPPSSATAGLSALAPRGRAMLL